MDEARPTWCDGRRFGRRAMLGGLVLAGGAGVGLAACSSGSPRSSTTRTAGFPVGAAAAASSKPVKLTLWHSMGSANLTALTHLTAQFNTSQSHVHVVLVNQSSYTDTLTAYTAALSGGNLPDLVQMETAELQFMIDSQSIVTAQSAVEADHYDLSDYVASTVEFFRVDGTLWALPFNISSQVLYYDRKAFSAAGLDPGSPPTTLVELRNAAQKIVGTGTEKYGMSLKVTDSSFELLLALAGGDLLNHGNGRSARATAAAFDDAQGRAIFEWWGGMLDDKLAQPTSFTDYDNLFAIANRIAPMTWDTSAAIGTILGLLSSYPESDLAITSLPRPTAPDGGVFVGGAGMFMVAQSPPERQDAAWQFMKFLNEPAQQAAWAVATGYTPVRRSATQVPALVEAWAKVPGYRVAYEEIVASPTNSATAGPVTGAFSQVGNAINDALTTLASGAKPDTALAQAAAACNQAITSYNARV